MEGFSVVLALIVYLVFIIAGGKIAKNKGRSMIMGGFMGAIMGPIGLLILYVDQGNK